MCFTCTWSFLEIPRPVLCFSMECFSMRLVLLLFPMFLSFYLNLSLCFLFLGRKILWSQFFFGVGQMKFMLVDSTKVVLFFKRFWIVSCLFCISDSRSEFSFSRKTILFLEYYYSMCLWLSDYQFLCSLILSCLTLTLMMKLHF